MTDHPELDTSHCRESSPRGANPRELSLPYRLFRWTGPHYLTVMVGFTRLFAAVFGTLCVVYVNETMGLTGLIRWKFTTITTLAICVAVVVTTFTALWQTRHLRELLRRFRNGSPADPQLQRRGAWEALVFPEQNTIVEFLLDPLLTVFPICLMLYFNGVGLTIAVQTCIAGFMGISCFLMTTFLIAETWLRPVVQHLLEAGVPVPFDELPQKSLRRRLQIGFGTTILVTATMISGLAYRRTEEIVRQPEIGIAAVRELTGQITAVTLLSLVVGISYSRAIANSITVRVAELLTAMHRVQQGELTFHIEPNGADEIDVLTRQFNHMVHELADKERQVQQLTMGLEAKVAERTRQLTHTVDQLRAMQEQMVHTEKMTSLGQLVAGLAHEINNAINAVYNGTPSVLKRLRGIEARLTGTVQNPAAAQEMQRDMLKIYRLMEVVEEGANRTARIVQDMKTFSHPQPGGVVDVDLNRTLDLCLNLLRLPRPGEINVVREYASIPQLRGPFGQLDQVFLNLLSNAVDAMPQGGLIQLRTEVVGDRCRVTIIDTGAGIPAENRQQIFNPFFTTKPPGKGTGLGLSISYGIIHKLGGRIDVSSTVGVGTQFEVWIPRFPAAREMNPPPLAPSFHRSPSDHQTTHEVEPVTSPVASRAVQKTAL